MAEERQSFQPIALPFALTNPAPLYIVYVCFFGIGTLPNHGACPLPPASAGRGAYFQELKNETVIS